ncbi:YceI family protein [Kitasatospora kifunensis]|uniref:Polyisoprenoid-binding protein YceI n=1 Tax=Kitasatospora kifunensis TaxID=58351 RepID=A0A7W7QXH4_KITKI|nr:YceI family protein [Kitasatospora kifunensis]MBB4921610.1 polyisoprenoid-binding protein YceI [Kitasatospora kifunensis]
MSSTPLTELTGEYLLDPAHTRIGFVARHAMVTKVRGHFKEFEGSAHLDGNDPSKSSTTVTIKTASIDTGNEQRDGHLRTNDFLDAPKFPEIVFTSTGIEALGGERYRLNGNLTIKDVTRPVSLDVEYDGSARDPFGNLRVGFEGSTTISRKDYGITWNAPLEGGGVLVGDKVVLEFDVSAIRQD